MLGRAAWLVLVCTLLAGRPVAAQTWGLYVRDVSGLTGVEIFAISLGTPPELAGLRPGDVVLRLDGKAVVDARDFTQRMEQIASGTTVGLAVRREGRGRVVRIEFRGTQAGLGLTVVDAPAGQGALVIRFAGGEPAATAGIESGDIVNFAYGLKVRHAADLLAITGGTMRATQAGTLRIVRAHRERELVVAALPANVGPHPSALPGPAADSRRPAALPAPDAAQRGPSVGAAATAAASANVVDTMVEANRHYDAGRFADAEVLYAKVVEFAGSVPLVWGRLCHARVALRQFSAALEVCRMAAQESPHDPIAHRNLGYALWRMRRHEEARTEYERVIERDPGDQLAWQALGDLSGELEDSAAAVAHYRKALELGPGSAGIYRALGWHLYHIERYAEAETALTQAARLDPADANILVTLGNAKFKLGKLAEARDAWQAAVELAPHTPTGAIARKSLEDVPAVGAGSSSPLGEARPSAISDTAAPRGAQPSLPRPEPRAAPKPGEPEFDPGS